MVMGRFSNTTDPHGPLELGPESLSSVPLGQIILLRTGEKRVVDVADVQGLVASAPIIVLVLVTPSALRLSAQYEPPPELPRVGHSRAYIALESSVLFQ